MANFDNNNSSYKDIPPNMINFENKVRATMENFKKCTEEFDFDNNHLMTVIVQMVKEQREKFHKFAKGSIKFSDHLADYSIDILFFTDCFKNDRYSNEDVIELLNDILNKSKENLKLVKELKNIIAKETEENMDTLDTILKDIKDGNMGGIKENLTEINEFLQKYIKDIEEHPGLIDLNKIIKIEKESNKGEFYKGTSFTYGMIFAATLAIAVAAPPLAAAEGFGLLLGTSAFGGIFSLVKNCESDEKIRNIFKQLNLERDELVEKIRLFDGSLRSVISQISVFDTFWITQIERIEHLITNLRVFDDKNKRYKQDLNVIKIEKQWKDVEDECKIYSSSIRNALNADVLLRLKS